MIVEARTPGTVIYGTPAQFRRAAARLGTEEPRVCVEAIDAMAEAVEYVFDNDLCHCNHPLHHGVVCRVCGPTCVDLCFSDVRCMAHDS